jgi:hypothetical protein
MIYKNPKRAKTEKLSWKGVLTSVKPRIRLLRSFDERSHTYLGYVLTVQGVIGSEEREFSIGIGRAAQAMHQFRIGAIVSGQSLPVEDTRKEPVEFYKTSKLKIVERSAVIQNDPPPWHGTPPDLETYRERGHRRLDARTYGSKCQSCIWGCRMPVEMIIDHWNPEKKRYRFETFCYGPKSCSLYEAGATREVPGRKGMAWEEPDWVDEEAVAHRGMD